MDLSFPSNARNEVPAVSPNTQRAYDDGDETQDPLEVNPTSSVSPAVGEDDIIPVDALDDTENGGMSVPSSATKMEDITAGDSVPAPDAEM